LRKAVNSRSCMSVLRAHFAILHNIHYAKLWCFRPCCASQCLSWHLCDNLELPRNLATSADFAPHKLPTQYKERTNNCPLLCDLKRSNCVLGSKTSRHLRMPQAKPPKAAFASTTSSHSACPESYVSTDSSVLQLELDACGVLDRRK